jgi:hypothetical protein
MSNLAFGTHQVRFAVLDHIGVSAGVTQLEFCCVKCVPFRRGKVCQPSLLMVQMPDVYSILPNVTQPSIRDNKEERNHPTL